MSNNNNNNNKMKGLLKGLRYISQIFENEKEQEMQIGYPTDVKHVGHIGWDGPSVTSPSWMNEYQQPPGSSSAPLMTAREHKEDNSVPSSPKTVPSSPARDLPELPKPSRRHSSTGTADSHSKERSSSDRPKQARRSSRNSTKDLPDCTKHAHNTKDEAQEGESSSNLPDIPKKSRRKKSRDTISGPTRSSRSSKSQAAGDAEGGCQSGSPSRKGTMNGSTDQQQQCRSLALSPLEEGGEKGFTGIS